MVWDSTTVDDLRATVADCQMQVVIVDSCGNREHKWAIGASIKWPWTELKLMILMGEQFLEKMPIARKEQKHWQIKMERGEFALCRHGTILSNWYFTERLSDEDFFGNWQLLSKIFSWFRIEIKINKRPKNLTCCVAEVDIVWRLLCKMTLILVSTFEFVCICNVYLWYKQDDLIFEILRNWYVYLNENRPWGVTWGLSTVNQEESQEQATDPASKLTSSTTSKLEGGTSRCPPSGSHNEALDHPSVDLWEALG